MLPRLLRFGGRRMTAQNENAPPHSRIGGEAIFTPSRARALATGAALAVSLDASPAVLVSIYDYARRFGEGRRRRSS
jgi:hypothetical protein